MMGFGLPWPMSPGCTCPVLDGGHCVLWPVTSGVTAGTAGMPVSPTPSHWWPVAHQAPRWGHHGGLGGADFSPHLLQVTSGPQGTGEFAPAENCSHPASWGCSSPGKFWLFAAVLPSAMTIPCLMLSGVACPGSLSFWGYDPMRSCHTPQVPLAAPSHAQPPATTELGP